MSTRFKRGTFCEIHNFPEHWRAPALRIFKHACRSNVNLATDTDNGVIAAVPLKSQQIGRLALVSVAGAFKRYSSTKLGKLCCENVNVIALDRK